VVHVDSPAPGKPNGYPTIIGEDVLIGHLAMVHGCELHDRAFVGLGAIVMSSAVVESDGMLAAGAMLTGGKRVGSRQLWGGRPAAYMRDLTDAALADMQRGVAHYVENGQAHAAAIGASLGQAQG
jgi:carbonic anhydrase/acetyltransferase-like protein (isoleucine patch superfamily)